MFILANATVYALVPVLVEDNGAMVPDTTQPAARHELGSFAVTDRSSVVEQDRLYDETTYIANGPVPAWLTTDMRLEVVYFTGAVLSGARLTGVPVWPPTSVLPAEIQFTASTPRGSHAAQG